MSGPVLRPQTKSKDDFISQNCKSKSNKIFKNEPNSVNTDVFNKLCQETQQLIQHSERLVYLMTHVCYRKFSGIFRTSHMQAECCRVGKEDYDCPSLRENEDSENQRAFMHSPGGRLCPTPRPVMTPESPRAESCTCGPSLTLKNRYHKSSNWRPFLRADPLQKVSNSHNPPSWIPGGDPLYWGQSPPNHPKPLRSIPRCYIIYTLILILAVFARVTESCSSRSTPKPRPASPTLRPNVTFQTYACPPAYAAWYCLNGATCFTVKLQDAILYNCECADGYMGQRCAYKDLDGSYLPESQRVLLESASIAGGACIAILLVFTVLFSTYVFVHRNREKHRTFDYDYNNQRQLQSGSSRRLEYVYTVSSLIPTGYCNPMNAKESESLCIVTVDVSNSTKAAKGVQSDDHRTTTVDNVVFDALRGCSL